MVGRRKTYVKSLPDYIPELGNAGGTACTEYETRAPIPSFAVDLGSPSPPPFSFRSFPNELLYYLYSTDSPTA